MEKIKLFLLQAGLPFAETLLRAFNDLYSRQVLTSAALAGGAAATFTYSAFHAIVNGGLVRVAGGTSPSMTGYNLTSAQVGGFVMTTDPAGVIALLPMNPAATAAQVGWPLIPANQAVVGLVLINTTGAATFTGGTTLTNAANVTLTSQVGPFYPNNIF